MAKKFSELRVGMSRPAREKADDQAKAMLAEMPLNGTSLVSNGFAATPIAYQSPRQCAEPDPEVGGDFKKRSV